MQVFLRNYVSFYHSIPRCGHFESSSSPTEIMSSDKNEKKRKGSHLGESSRLSESKINTGTQSNKKEYEK